MPQLRSVALRPPERDERDGFPFDLPVIASLLDAPLVFDAPVTFLVGENGSGKSTVLEGIAVAARLITVGSAPADHDPTLVAGQAMARRLWLTWDKSRTRRGFFLRAEDFFGYATGVDRMRREMEAELAAIDADESLSPVAKGFAKSAYSREVGALRAAYDDGLDARSHGEGFLHLFERRVYPGGLYVLDEPETPLSPLRQLTLLSLLKQVTDAARTDAAPTQFIIATHSPILMALPGAAILLATDRGFVPARYDDLEHVTITRAFLSDPEAFLRHL